MEPVEGHGVKDLPLLLCACEQNTMQASTSCDTHIHKRRRHRAELPSGAGPVARAGCRVDAGSVSRWRHVTRPASQRAPVRVSHVFVTKRKGSMQGVQR